MFLHKTATTSAATNAYEEYELDRRMRERDWKREIRDNERIAEMSMAQCDKARKAGRRDQAEMYFKEHARCMNENARIEKAMLDAQRMAGDLRKAQNAQKDQKMLTTAARGYRAANQSISPQRMKQTANVLTDQREALMSKMEDMDDVNVNMREAMFAEASVNGGDDGDTFDDYEERMADADAIGLQNQFASFADADTPVATDSTPAWILAIRAAEKDRSRAPSSGGSGS